MRFFHAQRWAKVFLGASEEKAQEAFLCLKEIYAPVKLRQGAFFGRVRSFRLEKILRECAAKTADAGYCGTVLEIAIRFICLLTEKKCFQFIDLILEKIEQMLNEKNGIIDVTVESAFSVGGDFKKELEKNIIKMINTEYDEVPRVTYNEVPRVRGAVKAEGVKIKTQINPQLLGGYLIRINTFYIDASLKGQLEKMKSELSGCGGINV